MMTDVEVQEWLSDDERALFTGAMMQPLRELARARLAMLTLSAVCDGMPTGALDVHEPGRVVKEWTEDKNLTATWNVYQRMQEVMNSLREKANVKTPTRVTWHRRARTPFTIG